MKQWYHVAGVFGPNRTQLFIDGVLVAEQRGPTSFLRDVPNAECVWESGLADRGRLHIGHDSRYQNFARLFFGQIRDVRILRYSASEEEIALAAVDGVREPRLAADWCRTV